MPLSISAVILLWLAGPIAAEQAELEFDSLEARHFIEDGRYWATATIDGMIKSARTVVIEIGETGGFRAPVFVHHGGALSVAQAGDEVGPRVVENAGGRLVLALEPRTGGLREFLVAERTEEEVRQEVDDLLRAALVTRSHKGFRLKTDESRREFLVRVNVLAASRDEDVPVTVKQPAIPAKRPAATQKFLNETLGALGPDCPPAEMRKARLALNRWLKGEASRADTSQLMRRLVTLSELRRLKSGLGLPVSAAESDPIAKLQEKLHQARLASEVVRLSPDSKPQALAKLDIRQLRDALNAALVGKRIDESGIPAHLESQDLISAILRHDGAGPSPAEALAELNRGKTAGKQLDEKLEQLGLNRLFARSTSRRKKEALYEVFGWRAAIHQHRLNHLDPDRLSAAVKTRMAARLAAVEKTIAAKEPENQDPGATALKRLANQLRQEQVKSTVGGIRPRDLTDLYRPFPAGTALGKTYGFLGEPEMRQLRADLRDCGVDPGKLPRLTDREGAKLLDSVAQLTRAQSPQEVSLEAGSPALGELAKAMSIEAADAEAQTAAIWEQLRRYEVALRFEYDPPKGPDRNAKWTDPERLGILPGTGGPIAKVELSGTLEPEAGDRCDWWLMSGELAGREWKLAEGPRLACLTVVSSPKALYLKVRAKEGPKCSYRIVSDGTPEGRTIRRTERREFHQEIKGPPF